MENSVKLTRELNDSMHPVKKHVYSPNSMPSIFTRETIEWANNDDQYVIKLHRKTNLITGHFYDWDEEAQDWTDKHDVAMTAQQILDIIKNDHLLLIHPQIDRGRI